MQRIYPWLYVDYKERLWKFSVNEEGELLYRIMYREGKWTKDNLIDGRVTGFGLFVDENEGIHIVYSNTKGEIRYCTLKEQQWLGKVLYNIENENYDIESIKIELVGAIMHIFFVLASKDGSDHGILMHCIWDGKKVTINKLQDIILKSGLKEYYLININNKVEIYLFYLSDEGDEISLNYSIYKGNRWSGSKRLYGIQGEEVYFEVQLDNNNIHILNKSKEEFTYSLDHVFIDQLNGIESYNLYTGENEIKDPLIFKEENRLCACWIEDNNIYYSIFNIMKWDKPKKFSNENIEVIEGYNAYISDIKMSTIDEVKLYGTLGLDLYLYHPKDFIINNEENKKNLYSEEIEEYVAAPELTSNEVYKLKQENKLLEDKVNSLNLILKKNQKIIENQKDQVIRAMDQKRKAEENSSVFLELQKKVQKEYDNLLKEVSLLKKEKSSMEIKLEEEREKYELQINEKGFNIDEEISKYINQIEELNEKIRIINKEKINSEEKINNEHKKAIEKLNTLEQEKAILEIKIKEYDNRINELYKSLMDKDRDFQEKENINKELDNHNKILIEEKELLKKEITSLMDENKRLNMELEIEKNQSVMERLLRRRS